MNEENQLTEQVKLNQKLNQAIDHFYELRLKTRVTTSFNYRDSVENLEQNYKALCEFDKQTNLFANCKTNRYIELVTQETNNSIQLYNSLNEIDGGDIIDSSEFQIAFIRGKLANISRDLSKRWDQSLYSMLKNDSKEVRHFCDLVKKIPTQIIDYKAPDDAVRGHFLDTDFFTGKPTIDYKLKYIFDLKLIHSEVLRSYVESDIFEISVLCNTLIDYSYRKGAGFSNQQLLKLEKRVLDTIEFLFEL